MFMPLYTPLTKDVCLLLFFFASSPLVTFLHSSPFSFHPLLPLLISQRVSAEADIHHPHSSPSPIHLLYPHIPFSLYLPPSEFLPKLSLLKDEMMKMKGAIDGQVMTMMINN